MKSLNILILFFLLSSCGVPQSEYEELKEENNRLKEELATLNEEKLEYMKQYRVLLEEKSAAEKQKAEVKKRTEERKVTTRRYSEADAIMLIQDYFDYYNADYIMRNPRARRISDNQFTISLEECNKNFKGNDFFWNSIVYDLKILPNGNYEVKPQRGF